MEFIDAKTKLKERYITEGFELVEENQGELFFKYPKRDTRIIRISKEEISEYLEYENEQQIFKTEPVECSICSTIYREHMVDVLDYGEGSLLLLKDIVFTFGEPYEGNIYAEIGPASNLFVNFFRFDKALKEFSIRRLYGLLSRRGTNKFIDMRDSLFKPQTIKIHNMQAPNIDAALRRSNLTIDACLFELSYLRGITLTLHERWPLREPRIRPFKFGEQFNGNQLPFPRVSFNADIVRFYQRGMSTEDPVNRFLSFYHVLEYFFVNVSDEQLYNKLSQRINDPKFSTSPKNLDNIIRDTLKHRRETDETEMLKLVLNKFVDEAELIEFIKAYEMHIDENLYSKRRTIFGEGIEVKLEPGHIISNLAKRIKFIRNALVHSSDRYDRNQSYVPTASAENMIRQEIPLMEYLAEKVIIASAK